MFRYQTYTEDVEKIRRYAECMELWELVCTESSFPDDLIPTMLNSIQEYLAWDFPHDREISVENVVKAFDCITRVAIQYQRGNTAPNYVKSNIVRATMLLSDCAKKK
jgi:hypothetical protein